MRNTEQWLELWLYIRMQLYITRTRHTQSRPPQSGVNVINACNN